MSRQTILPVSVIISTIKNSKSGKYVVIEGADDIIVYRILMTLYSAKGINVIPAGGRDKVLEVFNNLKNTPYLNKAIFIVDQDSWVFSGIPNEYQHDRIICTSGYSIENDVYLDKQLDILMQGTGVFSKFKTDLEQYLKWFSLAITRFCNASNPDGEKLNIHPTNFFQSNESIEEFCSLLVDEVFPQETYEDLLINYGLKFRGKCLLPLAIRALGARPHEPKYNPKTIMEETAITGRGKYLNLIFNKVHDLA